MGARYNAASRVSARVEQFLAVEWSALAREFGTSAVETAHAKGLIQRALHGIYAIPGSEAELRVRARALSLWTAPYGAVTGLAAAHLWGVIEREPDRVSVQVPSHWSRALPPWARAVHIGPASDRFRLQGIVTVSVADAVVQSWREARPEVAVSTVLAALVDNHVPGPALLEALQRRKQMPRRGQLVELISLAGKVVTSYLEYVAWKSVFPPRIFPQLRWQVVVWPRGRKRVMDAFDAEARIDLEFDGGATHGGVAGFERDRERDADMRSMEVEPLHFTFGDLIKRPQWCRQQYRELRAKRLREPGGPQAT